ncbi:MAG TPA: DUF3592 domain-containing protein [Archangium sp.]|nr:DUF3592 domain-containing protein [Archangium sp.]
MGVVMRVVVPLFLIGWSAFTLTFDGKILKGLVRQSLAASYPHVPGTITHSQVVERRGGDGSSYGFEVRYVYEAAGRQYEGTHYRYGDLTSSHQRSMDGLARRFPAGATVPVFHPPEAPADAVLVPGVQGHDLFMLLFLTPFNLMMLVGWYGVYAGLRKEEEGVGAFTREGRVHVISAVAVGLLTLGGASLVVLFAVGLVTGFEPPLPVAVLSWAAVIATSVAVARRQRAKLDAGAYDLILDEPNRRLSLPVGPGREERLDVPWSQVKSVLVEERTQKDSDGDFVTHWYPTVVLTAPEGQLRNEALVEWNDETKATALVKWLGERLTPLGGPR